MNDIAPREWYVATVPITWEEEVTPLANPSALFTDGSEVPSAARMQDILDGHPSAEYLWLKREEESHPDEFAP